MKAGQPDRKSRTSPSPIAMKEKKGHKWDRSVSSTRNADSDHRCKWPSGQDSSRAPDQFSPDESAATGATSE